MRSKDELTREELRSIAPAGWHWSYTERAITKDGDFGPVKYYAFQQGNYQTGFFEMRVRPENATAENLAYMARLRVTETGA